MINFQRLFHTKKRASANIVNEQPCKLVTFGIPLAPATLGDWAHTCKMLEHTLDSVFNQSDSRFRILISGHQQPDIGLLNESRVEFLLCKEKPPKNPGNHRKDVLNKNFLIGKRLRELGGGYFMHLDADDLVHKDLVKFILNDDNKTGYSIRQGYALDYFNKRLAPVPGAWDASFDQVCGSCAVIYFNNSDLPFDGADTSTLAYNMFRHHAYWRVTSQELGRPLVDLPFPGAIYIVNHSQNISFSLQRNALRQKNIIANIKEHEISRPAIILSQFGFRT